MRAKKIRVKNFRSILDVTIDLASLTVICGPNSCGKSNVFRAFCLAFEETVTKVHADENLPRSLLGPGGPTLSIWVDVTFEQVPAHVQNIVGVQSPTLEYSFRLSRAGKVTRKLGGVTLTDAQFAALRGYFQPLYIPPIRDLATGGLAPLQELLRTALNKSKGQNTIGPARRNLRNAVTAKAQPLLGRQKQIAKTFLGASSLEIRSEEVSVDALADALTLVVRRGAEELPLAEVGTGHQSAVIMGLYRELGQSAQGEVLFLFEEPDNHLHTATIRAMANDMAELAKSSQVVISTHSPILIGIFGVGGLVPLALSAKLETEKRPLKVPAAWGDRELRRKLDHFGLRLTEPLFAAKVIVVEGPTDRAFFEALYEHVVGNRCEEDNVLVVPAGGKGSIPDLIEVLDALSANWRVVLDWDAVLSGEVSMLAPGAPAAAALAAIATLQAAVTSGNRRGANFHKSLGNVEDELNGNVPIQAILNGSPLEKILDRTGELTGLVKRAELKTALTKKAKMKYWSLLEEAGVWVWEKDLEEQLLLNPVREQLVGQALVALNLATANQVAAAGARDFMAKTLHQSGYRPEIYKEIIARFALNAQLGRSHMNRALGCVRA
jgi:ABC-type transport system involved in cytochrome c biogenesis ATPase subunit